MFQPDIDNKAKYHHFQPNTISSNQISINTNAGSEWCEELDDTEIQFIEWCVEHQMMLGDRLDILHGTIVAHEEVHILDGNV